MSIARFRSGVRVPRASERAVHAPVARTRRAPRPHRAGVRLALTVWWRGTELDRLLAAGEDPSTSEALALRARRLTTERSRTRLAKGLSGVMKSAANGATPDFTAAVRPHAPDALEAAAVIESIERRLRGRGQLAPSGVAMVRLLLIDGNGPLYQPSDPAAPGTLGSRLRAAAAAL